MMSGLMRENCPHTEHLMRKQVLTCGRDDKTLAAALKQWREQGFDAHGIVADVSEASGRSALIQKVRGGCSPPVTWRVGI